MTEGGGAWEWRCDVCDAVRTPGELWGRMRDARAGAGTLSTVSITEPNNGEARRSEQTTVG